MQHLRPGSSCAIAVGVAALATTSIVVLASPDAHAFCRGLTQAGPDPASTGVCFDGGGTQGTYELYWRGLCVGYSLQKDASAAVTLDQATQVAAQAFGAWSKVTCPQGGSPSITAHDEGPVSCGLVQYNSDQPNQHTIVFRDDGWPHSDPNNSLGLTTITYAKDTGEIYDADMELNSHDHKFVVGKTPGPGEYDLLGVMTHEAGHFFGLAHSTDRSAMMWTFYTSGAATLTPDDVQGICSIYPPGGMRTTSEGGIEAEPCDAAPRHGFSTQCAVEGGLPEAAPPEVDASEDAGAAGGSGSNGGGCSVASSGAAGAGPWTRGFAALLGVALALLARRAKRATRTRGTRLGGVGLAGVAAAAIAVTLAGERVVRASVSIPVLLDTLVRDSQGAAIVTPLDHTSVWENGRIYTYTRAHIETAIAGDLPQGDLWVRTLGGEVGNIGQVVEGEAVLVPGESSLLFLRAAAAGSFDVTARAQGQFRLVQSERHETVLARSPSVGQLVVAPAGRLAAEVLSFRRVDEALSEISAAWAEARGR